ncbi:hypothetical protein Cgig2_028499 [Carnegiea gigantea]|uniref:Potassium channel domain-containing protein n=1 Tax=Carnegiea gigantea TaxID=171969 RepID=A0A9Q1JVP8_9CARY|nr:hypothetical protein Cgig2_028499 [Carnegiea gigantea]
MDEPFLPEIVIQGNRVNNPTTTKCESSQNGIWEDPNAQSLGPDKKRRIRSTQTFKKKLASGYLDRKIMRTHSTAKFRRTDSILPLLASLRANSITEDIEDTNTSASSLKPQFCSGHLRSDSISKIITSQTPNSIKETLINFHTTNSAPVLFTDEKGIVQRDKLNCGRHRQRTTTPKLIQVALLGFLSYIIIFIVVFLFTSTLFQGKRTHKLIDALYFSVVTLCTIGYGDIIPDTTFSKLFTSVFILVGFGFIDILLNGLVTYVLDMQEEVLLGSVDQNKFNKMIKDYIIDTEKGRMRIRIKMCSALGVVVICLATGTVTVHFVEGMTWVDSFYLSVTSVTTVGYGDYAFKTAAGRCFAVIWLLASTLAVARAFLYITEYRIEKRNRIMARKVLQKKFTLGDLMAADMDHDGSVSKPEYVIFKLKEMGMIEEKEIDQICKQFDNLDSYHRGKITMADLIEDYANKAAINQKDDKPRQQIVNLWQV